MSVTDKKTKIGVIRPFTCNECLHFKNKPLKGHDQVCSKEGVRGGALAPSCFTPNVAELSSNSEQIMSAVHLMQSLDKKQRRTMFALMASKLKHKLVFGTTVYFRAVGGDYLSNYLKGFIAGTTSRGEIIVMGDPDARKRGKPYLAYFDNTDNLLTAKEFKAKRKLLKGQGRLEDPKVPLKKRRPSIAIDYQPPIIDSSFDKTTKRSRLEAVDKRMENPDAKPTRIIISSGSKNRR